MYQSGSNTMWLETEFKVVDEIIIGDRLKPGLHFRLVETPKGKQYIKLYSTLSKCWRTMYRYNVTENWNKWKAYANLHDQKRKD